MASAPADRGLDPLEELSQLASSLGLGSPETTPAPPSAPRPSTTAPPARQSSTPSKLPSCQDLLGCASSCRSPSEASRPRATSAVSFAGDSTSPPRSAAD
eukprot:2941123-Prymnesium_polylepis.1